MLYKVTDDFKLGPDATFLEAKGTPAYSHASKDSHGIWVTPTSGDLSVLFSIDKAMADSMSDIDPYDFSAMIERHQELRRVTVSYRKVAALLGLWRSVDEMQMEQKVLLNAMSRDIIIEYPHIVQMIKSRSALVEVVQNLLPCVPGQVGQFVTLRHVPTLHELILILGHHKNFRNFNIDNPNAHYKLDLESASDRTIAERLIVLDRWETGIARRLKRVDISQRGNWSQFRNEQYQSQRIDHFSSIHDWNMPEQDFLEFDYSTGRRPPAGAKPLDDVTLANILVNLHTSECSSSDKVLATQMITHLVYVTSRQLRGILGMMKHERDRLNMSVMWFPRVIDIYNEKIFRVRFEGKNELEVLRNRLGWIAMFPFIQPEQNKFTLNLAHYDERVCASFIIIFAAREHPENIIRNTIEYLHSDGTKDPLTAGLNRAWEDHTKMPTEGTLSFQYQCGPEDRNFQCRKQNYQTYQYRTMDVGEEEVVWWAGLGEAPPDVLLYVQWLTYHSDDNFASPIKMFQKIDGPGGNGVVNLREFEESFKTLHIDIFKSKKSFEQGLENKRIEGVFRYLDPTGEGTVSKHEWKILQCLWNEIKLSIEEFVQFCVRTFGQNLSDGWDFLDADGGGEIDLDEWVSACHELGYFGPTEPIFRYLDADNGGNIGKEEFEILEKYRTDEVTKTMRSMSRTGTRKSLDSAMLSQACKDIPDNDDDIGISNAQQDGTSSGLDTVAPAGIEGGQGQADGLFAESRPDSRPASAERGDGGLQPNSQQRSCRPSVSSYVQEGLDSRPNSRSGSLRDNASGSRPGSRAGTDSRPQSRHSTPKVL
jgi:hypothetical protein